MRPGDADQEVLQALTRARRLDDGVAIEVAVIRWPCAHTPHTDWQQVERLPLSADAAQLMVARQRALKLRRFFAVCRACGQRKPKGWMQTAGLCMACAQSQLGIVH